MRYRSRTNSNRETNIDLRHQYANAHPFCERCRVLMPGRPVPMDDVHHIFSSGGRHDLVGNIVSTCRLCHQEFFERFKTEGRIWALWLKMKKSELSLADVQQASGFHLAGWLECHKDRTAGVEREFAELSEFVALIDGADQCVAVQ